APHIDGHLDDVAWATVPGSDAFTQSFPTDGAAPSDPTRVQVAYDDQNVYVAVACTQHAPPLARLTPGKGCGMRSSRCTGAHTTSTIARSATAERSSAPVAWASSCRCEAIRVAPSRPAPRSRCAVRATAARCMAAARSHCTRGTTWRSMCSL